MESCIVLVAHICANIWAVLAGRENTQKRWQELNSVATKLTRLPLNFFSEKWIVKISNKSSTNGVNMAKAVF